jgi:hypothetical protein
MKSMTISISFENRGVVVDSMSTMGSVVLLKLAMEVE